MPRIEYPYECTMMGHAGGSRTFYAAPPEWFQQKGFSLPNKCEDCRAWIKLQDDELSSCRSCGTAIRIPSKRKISIFKRVGPYEPITECMDCSEGRRQPKGMIDFPDRKKRKDNKEPEEKHNTFESLRIGNSGISRRVVTSANFYHGKKMLNTKNNQEETWYIHIEHHIPGSVNDWTDPEVQAILGVMGKTSPTSLVASGSSVEDLLEQVGMYASMTDDSTIRDYTVGTSRIARVTYTGDDSNLELSILALDVNSEDCYVITSYDSLTAKDIENNDWY